MPGRVDTVRRLFAAHAEGGLEAVLAVSGDDVVWQPHLVGGRVLRGSDELRAALAGLAARGVEYEPRLLDLERRDDAVLAHGTLVVRGPDGVREDEVHWLFHFRDGRLVRMTSYAERADALAALTALRVLVAPPFLIGVQAGTASGEHVVHVTGELDVATAPRLEAILTDGRQAGDRLVVDMGGLRFMDSTGLRALLRGRRAAEEGGWELYLRRIPDPVRRLFDLAGVHAAVPPVLPDDG
jgi:anti-sigma B factor antagonist